MDYTNISPIHYYKKDLGALQHIPQPPAQLYIKGAPWDSLMRAPRIAVVGSRKTTAYGREATIQLVQQLARAGVIIVSGLALGIDSIAHQACLSAGGAHRCRTAERD